MEFMKNSDIYNEYVNDVVKKATFLSQPKTKMVIGTLLVKC